MTEPELPAVPRSEEEIMGRLPRTPLTDQATTVACPFQRSERADAVPVVVRSAI
jgi:hypothetical protein